MVSVDGQPRGPSGLARFGRAIFGGPPLRSQGVIAIVDAEPVTPAQEHQVVVTLPAEIDMTNSRQVCQQLDTAVASGAAIVVADMTATWFCDTMGLRALVMARKRATAEGAELRVATQSPAILRVMAIMELDSVLWIYPSVDAALATRPVG
jgi:anti-sigma B factor antagonist